MSSPPRALDGMEAFHNPLMMAEVPGFSLGTSSSSLHQTNLSHNQLAQLQNHVQDTRAQMQPPLGHLMQPNHHAAMGNQGQMAMPGQLPVHQHTGHLPSTEEVMHVHHAHMLEGDHLEDPNNNPLIGDDDIKVGTEKMKGRKNPKLSPRRKYKRYTPEQLRWAVNYMRKEKTTAGKAAKAAEKQFDLPADTIPKSTIWHYSHNPNRQIGKRPGVGTVLSDAEEKVLADHVGKSSNLGQLIGKKAIKELATKMLHNAGRQSNVKTKDGVLSNKWYKGFMKRHPHLKRQRGRSSSSVNVTSQATTVIAAQATAQAASLDLSQQTGNVDTRGVQRGNCTECDCAAYERPPDSITNNCFYCDHKPPSHKNLGPAPPVQMHHIEEEAPTQELHVLSTDELGKENEN